jgi:hypothetical protein
MRGALVVALVSDTQDDSKASINTSRPCALGGDASRHGTFGARQIESILFAACGCGGRCPGQPWGDVVRDLNRKPGVHWTPERLRRTVRRLAAEGLVEAALLDRARPQLGNDRLIRLVAGIKAAAPDRTLQQIAAQLEAMRERTPRGGTRWHPSSVKHLLDLARVRTTSAMATNKRPLQPTL